MISIEFFSVVVPKYILEEKYPNGIKQYKADVPNASYVDDEHLTRVAFMHPAPLDAFCENLIANGLHFDEAKHFSTDFVVVQNLIGKRWSADWLIQSENGNYLSIL